MRILIFVLNLFLLINCQKNDSDDAYEFGFTIDGQQHRHEKKDVNGIIQGEFGFITADGIYHVTVYATDENGNFHILSMRNIRISAPLDGSPLPKGAKIESYNGQKAAQPQAPQAQPNALQIAGPTTAAPRTQNAFTTRPTIKPACGGCGYVTTPKPKAGLFPFENPPIGSKTTSTVPGANVPGAGTAGVSAGANAGAGGTTSTYGNQNQGGSPPSYQSQPQIPPSYQNQPGSPPSYQNQPGTPPSYQSQQGASPPYQNQPGAPLSATSPPYQNQPGAPPSAASTPYQNQPGAPLSAASTPYQNQPGTSPSYQNQPGSPPYESQPVAPQTYSGQDQSSYSQGQPGSPPSDQSQSPYGSQPSGPNLFSGQSPGGNQSPTYVSGAQPQKDAENEALPNPLSNDNTPEKPSQRLSKVTVSDGAIHVPGNPDIPIKDKYPGMKDGLPEGITENDITDLLYKFNYTVGFHGQYEKGYKNGAKVGGYFVNGRDGLSRVVTYVADENGFRPKVKFIRLGLDSPDTPKEETEKTFGLKHFEFVWYPIK